ncbi:MAG: Rieske 2Fe-2S domain-containing protein [Desulfurivibrionaceae bacterium]|nr:Rieske 2Fe-2S domain-containing protein [Desulfobulbales bacterium]MDT8336107.1 Rieske 2Fe-2S domain-containing protein [Desulfurivibrionaceae bacterium]
MGSYRYKAQGERDKNRAGPIVLDRRAFLAWVRAAGKFAIFSVLLLPFAGFINFTPAKKPKFVKVNRPLKKGGFIIEAEFILFDTDTGPVAVSRTCTHLGCLLNYHELDKMLICPCHASRFSKQGKRLAGPAQLDLPTFPVEKTGADEVAGYVVAVT